MEKQRPKHEAQIGFRVPQELRERLDRVHEKHLTSDAGVFRALAEAFCDEAERQQRVAMPLRIYFSDSDSVEAAQRWALNEPPAGPVSSKKSTRPAAGKKTGG